MTEISFAKQFLTTLDSRPVRIPSDYTADARQLPAQSAYILPRNAKPYTAPTSTTPQSTAAGASSSTAPQTLTVTLKTIRPTPTTPTALTLPAQTRQTSIYDIKALAARRAGFAPDKVKILWEKRPVSDSKTVEEVAGADAVAAGNVALNVMFMGSPTAVPEPEAGTQAGGGAPVANADAAALEAAAGSKDAARAGGGEGAAGGAAAGGDIAVGKSGWEVCETSEFWDDLGAFVLQRVRDEQVAKELLSRFREGWKGAR